MPSFEFEHLYKGVAAGVDEAGRGPLAGAVYAAACVLDEQKVPAELLAAINDSKKLTPAKREKIYDAMKEFLGAGIELGVGSADAQEVDELNILNATFLAMRRALEKISGKFDFALIDGNRLPPNLPYFACTIVGGDAKSFSIAAASIAAKVERDAEMLRYAEIYPKYGFEIHKGYGTAAHIEALHKFGPSPIHRKTFEPIKTLLKK